MDRSSRAQLEALFRLRIVHIFTLLAGPRNPDNRLHGDESGGSPIPCSLAGCRKTPIARAVAGALIFEAKTEVGAPLKAPRTIGPIGPMRLMCLMIRPYGRPRPS